LLTTFLAALAVSTAVAADIYVDNVIGVDGNDGTAVEIKTPITGPVRTLRRGAQLLQRGDALVILNTGRPYYEALCLSGGRHSGVETFPLVVRGNGATLSGVRQLPAQGWQSLGGGLWRLTLTRKGHYRFFRDGNPWPEYIPADSFARDALPEGQWAPFRGDVYFRFPEREPPVDARWTYAADEQGISLVDVRHVQIVDLQVVGFRVDGINVDNACRAVTLQGVTVQHNGRAGLAVGGSSRVKLASSRVTDNGRYSVLVTESAGVDIEACDLGGVEPTLAASVPPGKTPVADAPGSPVERSVSVSAAASTSANFRPVVLKR
jgi:hypothetical protein